MAHGYLTPESANNKDLSLFKTIGDLLKAMGKRGKDNGPPPETGGALAIVKKGQNTDIYKEPDVQEVKVQEEVSKGGALAKRAGSSLMKHMGGALSNMIKRGGPGAITTSGGGPSPGAGRSSGPSASPTAATAAPLNAASFLNKQTGDVDIEGMKAGGFSRDEMIDIVRQARQIKRDQGIAPTGETLGDSDLNIVAALSRNTDAITTLVKVTQEQTDNDTQLANAEIQSSEAMFTRQLAAAKENAMEKGGDLSSAITPDAAGGKAGGGGIMGALGGLLGGKGGGLLKGLGGLGKGLKGLKGLGGKLLGKGAAKGATKGLLKGGLKMGIKKIPFLGLGAAALFAGQRALAGDFAGAGLELASGGASMIPGLGTAASLGIDAALMARDATSMPSMAGGGLTSGPKTGYLSMMHGTELTLSGTKSRETVKIGEGLGEGMFLNRKKHKKDFAKFAADGMTQYYDKESGWDKFVEKFKQVISSIGTFISDALYNIFSNIPILKNFVSKKDKPGGNGGGAGGSGGSGGGRSPKYTASDGTLKGKIRSLESGGDYGSTFKKYLGGFSRKDEDITKMTINQVVQYQKDYIAHQRGLGIKKEHRSAAVGAYQMLYPDRAARALGIDLNSKFDQETQDKLAEYYLNMAGQQDYLSGKITAEQYNDGLAGQFASIKKADGSGVYDNDGLNSAYGTVLDEIKGTKAAPIENPPVDTKTKGISPSFLGNRNYGLETGQGLNVGIGGQMYRVVKTDDGWKVLKKGGLFGGDKELKPDEIPAGLEQEFMRRYKSRTTDGLNPANKDQASAVSGASSDVASADRALNGKTTTVVMPEVASAANAGSSGVPVMDTAAAGSEGQGLQAFVIQRTA